MIPKLIIEIQEKPIGFAINDSTMVAKDGVWLDSIYFWGVSPFYALNSRTMAALQVASAWKDYDCILAIVNPQGVCLIQSDSDPKLDKFTNPVYDISPEEAYIMIEEAYAVCSVHTL